MAAEITVRRQQMLMKLNPLAQNGWINQLGPLFQRTMAGSILGFLYMHRCACPQERIDATEGGLKAPQAEEALKNSPEHRSVAVAAPLTLAGATRVRN
jgi:hypothetical protein